MDASTLGDFELASAVEAVGPGRFRAALPEGWRQGRGAFGGLVLGTMARALIASDAEPERPLRALSGEILAPVTTSPLELRLTQLRRGSAVSTWEAVLTQEGEVRARATGIFGKERAYREAWAPEPPRFERPWREVPVAPIVPPLAPEFGQYLEFRPTGLLPFSGAREATAEGWVRFHRPLRHLGPPELTALLDAHWPAALAREAGPRPAATIAFTAQYYQPQQELALAAPVYHRARAAAAQHGYVLELRELWSEQGELLGTNQQTFVIIK